jgi:hypothetical protein
VLELKNSFENLKNLRWNGLAEVEVDFVGTRRSEAHLDFVHSHGDVGLWTVVDMRWWGCSHTVGRLEEVTATVHGVWLRTGHFGWWYAGWRL